MAPAAESFLDVVLSPTGGVSERSEAVVRAHLDTVRNYAASGDFVRYQRTCTLLRPLQAPRAAIRSLVTSGDGDDWCGCTPGGVLLFVPATGIHRTTRTIDAVLCEYNDAYSTAANLEASAFIHELAIARVMYDRTDAHGPYFYVRTPYDREEEDDNLPCSPGQTILAQLCCHRHLSGLAPCHFCAH